MLTITASQDNYHSKGIPSKERKQRRVDVVWYEHEVEDWFGRGV